MNDGPTSTGLFDELRDGMNAIIDKLEGEQIKIDRANFESMEMGQRARYLRALEAEGISRKRMEKLTGKDQSTISRTINRS